MRLLSDRDARTQVEVLLRVDFMSTEADEPVLMGKRVWGTA